MKNVSISLDYDFLELKIIDFRELAVFFDNESCARGLNCSFTADFIDKSVRLSFSLISGEEFTYDFFIDVMNFVKDVFEKKNIFLKVSSISAF